MTHTLSLLLNGNGDSEVNAHCTPQFERAPCKASKNLGDLSLRTDRAPVDRWSAVGVVRVGLLRAAGLLHTDHGTDQTRIRVEYRNF